MSSPAARETNDDDGLDKSGTVPPLTRQARHAEPQGPPSPSASFRASVGAWGCRSRATAAALGGGWRVCSRKARRGARTMSRGISSTPQNGLNVGDPRVRMRHRTCGGMAGRGFDHRAQASLPPCRFSAQIPQRREAPHKRLPPCPHDASTTPASADALTRAAPHSLARIRSHTNRHDHHLCLYKLLSIAWALPGQIPDRPVRSIRKKKTPRFPWKKAACHSPSKAPVRTSVLVQPEKMKCLCPGTEAPDPVLTRSQFRIVPPTRGACQEADFTFTEQLGQPLPPLSHPAKQSLGSALTITSSSIWSPALAAAWTAPPLVAIAVSPSAPAAPVLLSK